MCISFYISLLVYFSAYLLLYMSLCFCFYSYVFLFIPLTDDVDIDNCIENSISYLYTIFNDLLLLSKIRQFFDIGLAENHLHKKDIIMQIRW